MSLFTSHITNNVILPSDFNYCNEQFATTAICYLKRMHAECTDNDAAVFVEPSAGLVARVVPIHIRRNVANNVVVQHLNISRKTQF